MNASAKIWLLAARPKTLTAAFIPILVSWALVPKASVWLALSALLASLFIQIGTNLINDAIDGKRGTDRERIGPQRVTQSGLLSFRTVYLAGWLAFLLAFCAAVPLMVVGSWPLVGVIFISILAGYAYTGGPFPLSYLGLGDLFVFLFFGLIATCTMEWLYSGHVTESGVVAGSQIGLLAVSLIAINNLRDRATDARTHKKTLAVRFGERFAKIEITLSLLLPFLLGGFWWDYGKPFATLLPLTLLPLSTQLVWKLWKSTPGPSYNLFLAQSALIHLAFGIWLAIGLSSLIPFTL